jgi:hypothetical protein
MPDASHAAMCKRRPWHAGPGRRVPIAIIALHLRCQYQTAMPTDLPFDPPYKLAIVSSEGTRWVEIQPDGSQVDTSAPQTTFPPASAPRAASARDAGAKAQTFLTVPYAEKDDAKRLGARWDATRKKWYVPQGVDAEPFSRWINT